MPDRGIVALRNRAGSVAKSLFHLVTGEEAEVPHSAGVDASLGFDGDGFGFVDVAGAQTWCNEIFELRLVEDEGAHFVLRAGGTEAIPLKTWLSDVKRLSIATSEAEPEAGLGVWLFDRPWWGARAWWSLADLWRRACPEGRMSCSQWQQSWWPWWRATLEEISLPVPHFRRACPYNGRQGRKAEDDTYFGVEPRVLEEATLSSHACIAILARLACPRRVANAAAKTNTMNWARLLENMCCNLVVPSCPVQLVICLDDHVVGAPFPASGGRAMVELGFEQGRVDLKPLAEACTFGHRLFGMLGRAESMTMWDLLIHLYRLGKPAKEVFKQFVCYCGCAVDSFVVACGGGPAPMEVDGGDGARASAEEGTAERATTGRVSMMVQMAAAFQAGGRRMLRYFFCARKMFKSAQFLGLSVDASRVARKNVLLGVLTVPENIGAWCPPQVAPDLGHAMARLALGEDFGERFANKVYVMAFVSYFTMCGHHIKIFQEKMRTPSHKPIKAHISSFCSVKSSHKLV